MTCGMRALRSSKAGLAWAGILGSPLPRDAATSRTILCHRHPDQGHERAHLLNVSRWRCSMRTAVRSSASPAVGGFLSDSGLFHERITTPDLRLFQLMNAHGRAVVVNTLRTLASDEHIVRGLSAPRTLGVDLRREALAVEREARHVRVPSAARASRAWIEQIEGNRINLRAEGPGVLVVAEGWDPGWSVRIDDRSATPFRVNHAQIGCVLGSGMHRIALRYHARGLMLGALHGCRRSGEHVVAGVFRSSTQPVLGDLTAADAAC